MSEKRSITKAMVLGAGMGSRMRDLTRDRPKPMVPVGGRPLIDHVLDRLDVAGVTDVVVNVHYQADVLELHLRGRTVPSITISDERLTLLDTGGGVVKALPHFEGDSFFIHNSDSVWTEGRVPGLPMMVEAWNPDEMDTLLMLANPTTTLGYDGHGDFIIDDTGRLRRWSQQGDQALVFTGVSIVQTSFFANAPQGAFSLNVLWDRAMADGRAFGAVLDGAWMHVGTPEAVVEADAAFAKAAAQ